jgi:hypothetical protein
LNPSWYDRRAVPRPRPYFTAVASFIISFPRRFYFVSDVWHRYIIWGAILKLWMRNNSRWWGWWGWIMNRSNCISQQGDVVKSRVAAWSDIPHAHGSLSKSCRFSFNTCRLFSTDATVATYGPIDWHRPTLSISRSRWIGRWVIVHRQFMCSCSCLCSCSWKQKKLLSPNPSGPLEMII